MQAFHKGKFLVFHFICKSLFRFEKKVNHAKFQKRGVFIEKKRVLFYSKNFFQLSRNLIMPFFQNICNLLIKYTLFFFIYGVNFLTKGIFERKKLTIVGRRNYWTIGKVRKNISSEWKELFLTTRDTGGLALSWWMTTPHLFTNSGRLLAIAIVHRVEGSIFQELMVWFGGNSS